MDKKQRSIIRENLEKLVDVTDNLGAILELLLVRKVINAYMVNRILSIDDRKGKVRSFYLLMVCRGPTAYKHLRECLRNTQNIKAAELLEAYKETDRSYANFAVNIQKNVTKANVATYTKNTTSENDITIHPDKKFMDIEKDNLPNGVYRMRSKPRGFALVVNIENCTGMERRLGSEVDYRKINQLFNGLGYKVDSYVDLDKKHLEKVVKQFSGNPLLAKVDSVVVFIMSHGFPNKSNTSIELRTSDGLSVNTEWIIRHVTDSRYFITNASRRKPKIFFFQACRGYKRDTGRAYDEPLAVDSVSFSASPHQRTTFRQYEDVIIINSTINGYSSKRDPKEGGWFVNLFFDIVSKNAWRYDLETMIGQVDEQIRYMDSNYGFQTPEIVKQGMHKKIFFNPGLYENQIDTPDGFTSLSY